MTAAAAAAVRFPKRGPPPHPRRKSFVKPMTGQTNLCGRQIAEQNEKHHLPNTCIPIHLWAINIILL